MQEKNNKPDNDKAGNHSAGNNKEEKVMITKQEYESLKAKVEDRDTVYDKYLRLHAELENARKRMEKEKAEFLRYANESLIIELLPIIDSLEIAEKHIKEAKDFKAVQEGVDMIQAQIQLFLKDIGIERIKTIGEKFNPHQHDAIETEESKDKEDGIIVSELTPGYKFNGKLLRPAAVKIAKSKS